MMSPVVRPIAVGIRALSPFIWCLLLIALQLVPFGIPYALPIMPNLLLCGAFYWTVNRPELMPIYALFILGLVFDLLHAGPVGLMSLTLIAVNRFAASERRIFSGRIFVLSWWGFAMVACGYGAVSWLFNSLYLGHWLELSPIAMQTLMTISIYPVVAYGLGRFQRRVFD